MPGEGRMKRFNRGVNKELSCATPKFVKKPIARSIMLASLAGSMIGVSSVSSAQSDPTQLEEVVVTGIRSSLESALTEKRASDNLVEVIVADDIGKLPDQNLAEVLENITGVQITRQAGVGTNVQIRGTNSNRTEINGVATVSPGTVPAGSSGSDRNGINFEDINASIISSVEVTKTPEAKTTEGSVGGTVNLRTVRPLELKETLGSIRIQGEDSSLSTESIQPRLSGAFGDNWETSIGRFGWVVSGSYTEQEAVSLRPRVDRDGGLVPNVNADLGQGAGVGAAASAQSFDFLGIQFLTQETENDDFETANLATTLEFQPNDNWKFYLDAFINDQEQSRDQFRVQASGVSNLVNDTVPTAFETVNLGSIAGADLGQIQAALSGNIGNLSADANDPNLRVSSETTSRTTETQVFTLGTEFAFDRLSGKVEFTTSSADTKTPVLDTTLNFLNPNAPLTDLDALGNPTAATDNDNATPIVFDLSQGLSFGIDFASPFAPTEAQLLDPNNYTLDGVIVRDNSFETSDDQFRIDLSYQFEENLVTSVDFGLRLNEASSQFINIQDNIGGFSNLIDSPRGTLFSELIVQGPDNFASGDGRELAVSTFLGTNTDRAFSDPQGTIAVLERALLENNPDGSAANTQLQLAENQVAFYDIEEETTALYAQANFEVGIFRGNIGARYVDTTLNSTGFIDSQLTTLTGSYDFILPRFNLVANVAEDVVVRFGYAEDIRRPDFRNLNIGFTSNQNENQAIRLGNPGLEPEEVESIDLGVEWYFAPSAVASIGYFRKERTNIFSTVLDSAFIDQTTGFRETDPNCPGGGIFNPLVIPNVLGDPNTSGLCVDTTIGANDPSTTTQTGIELAFQYDLSSFEDSLGWASGFGILANATFQDFEGGLLSDSAASRGIDIFNAQVNNEFVQANFETFTEPRGLLDFSDSAYNITLFYEKYGLSARARYTWRDAFRTLDFAGGSSLNSTLGFPVVTEARGQLNASVGYDVTESINISVEAVNLTEEGITQSCLTEGGLTCFVGIPDRRITFGASYRF